MQKKVMALCLRVPFFLANPVDSVDGTSKHQYSFWDFIVSKRLVFVHFGSQIACYRNWIFEFHQKHKIAFLIPAANSLEEDIQNSTLKPVKQIVNTALITLQRRHFFLKKMFMPLYYNNKESYEPSKNSLYAFENDSLKNKF